MNLTSRLSPRLSLLALIFIATAALAADLPAPHLPLNFLPVPLVPQATSYSCGAASLMAVLEYWNVSDAPETTLFKPLHTTSKSGTSEYAMSDLAKKDYGLSSEIRAGMSLQDLRDALKDGTTVIVDLQAWSDEQVSDWKTQWEDGHYVVLVAMDADYAYFMDPSSHGAYAYIPLPELLDRWHDYDEPHGHKKPFYNLGILIHGSKPRSQYPSALIRML
jgi:predicted double-glycine peptidase